MSAPKYGLDFTYAAFVYPPMFEKPSVTFFSLPLRSGTRTDCRMPPYVRIDTDMPRVLVSVYLSTAVPSGRRPKLAFETRADWAPAGWASRPAARPASTAHSAARWIRLGLPLSRMTLFPPRGTGVGDSRPPGPQAASGRDRGAGLEHVEAGARVERVGRARDRLDRDPRAGAREVVDRIGGVDVDEAEALVQPHLDRALRAGEADPGAPVAVAREVAEARIDRLAAHGPRACEVVWRAGDRHRRARGQHPLVDRHARRRGDLEHPVVGAPAQVGMQPAAPRRRRVADVGRAHFERQPVAVELVRRLDPHRERVAGPRARVAAESDRVRRARADREALVEHEPVQRRAPLGLVQRQPVLGAAEAIAAVADAVRPRREHLAAVAVGGRAGGERVEQ